MQKATAYPISAVASLMAEGFFDNKKDEHRNYWVSFPKALSYGDVPFDKFNERLSQLGI